MSLDKDEAQKYCNSKTILLNCVEIPIGINPYKESRMQRIKTTDLEVAFSKEEA